MANFLRIDEYEPLQLRHTHPDELPEGQGSRRAIRKRKTITPELDREIRESDEPVAVLSARLDVSKQAIRRRREQTGPQRRRGRPSGSTTTDRAAIAAFEGTIADAALRFGCCPATVSLARKEYR